MVGGNTCALQCIHKAAEGRCWRPQGEGFAPKVLLLVEAFIGVTCAHVAEDCTVDCWNEPPLDIPCQRDEDAFTNIITYLDELASSRKAWDELVWPPVSSAPCMLPLPEHLGYIQSCIVEMGLTMPPSWFHISDASGGFVLHGG